MNYELKKKILFIDGSIMMQKLINNYLTKTGYIVYTTGDGEEGLEIYNKSKPDLILTDLKISGINGFEVLKYVKKNSKDIPVIIVSGEGQIKDVILALQLGAWDYITKPIEDLNIINYAIKRSLKNAELTKKNRLYEKNLEDIVKKRTIELELANKQLELTLDAIVNSLSTITEKKDQYTAGHQRRVSMLAVKIAEKLGIKGTKKDAIRIAGLLHDIGKIYVPVEILTKPSKLDQYEMEIIKRHSTIGYEIIKDIPFPWPIEEIIYQHHERLDGSGYPNGLKGDEILIEAKIIALADVVEAMSFHRPYRPALGVEAAISEIKNKSGFHFCPDCVNACLNICKEDKNLINCFQQQ